jgi:hypothetical protein
VVPSDFEARLRSLKDEIDRIVKKWEKKPIGIPCDKRIIFLYYPSTRKSLLENYTLLLD